jgi:hypothetical protein
MTSTDIPFFVPLPQPPIITQIPLPPSELKDRAAYFQLWSSLSPAFQQRTQPWFAARSVACTASNAAKMLGLSTTTSNHFTMFNEQQQQQQQQQQVQHFCMEWGVRHEMCGIASVMSGLDKVRSHLLSEHQVSMPIDASVQEQGLYIVPSCHPLLHGTSFSALIPLAASPDARLGTNEVQFLIEVKSACPFVERDDGVWSWMPCKKALGDKGIKMCHFVQCQVQMMATGVPRCLLVGWQVKSARWCTCPLMLIGVGRWWSCWRQSLLQQFPCVAKGQRFRSCQAMTNLCSAQKNAVVFSKSCAALEV